MGACAESGAEAIRRTLLEVIGVRSIDPAPRLRCQSRHKSKLGGHLFPTQTLHSADPKGGDTKASACHTGPPAHWPGRPAQSSGLTYP